MKEKVKPADVKYDNVAGYVTFQVHTAKYRTLPTKKYSNRKPWTKVDESKVYANIPGTIYKIYVKPGDKLEKGELLLEIDAMKMYNKFFAPKDCVINEILVNEGDKVSKNSLLLTVEILETEENKTAEIEDIKLSE